MSDKPTKVETKEHVNIVFIGHVDAGKSTLAGQLMIKTGQVDERSLEKITREASDKGMDSWRFAFLMDDCEEEREKGKTVEVARAFFETNKKRYTILDAPGHKAYVPSMIGGCSQADIAVLVISARKGEFETGFKRKGQTVEHATIAKTLGIKHLVVVINKMDEDTVKWSKKRYDGIKKELNTFLLKKLGFNKKYVKYVPISGLTGINITERMDNSTCPWYKGPSFVGQLDEIQHVSRDNSHGLRIPIIDSYKDTGSIVCLGKIESGEVKKGEQVIIMPGNIKATVTNIKAHAKKIEEAQAGENVELFLKTNGNLQSGMVICSNDPKKLCQPIQEFIGNLLVLDKTLFAAGYSASCHVHTAVERVTVTSLLQKLDKKTGKPIPGKPKFGKTGEVLNAKFKFDNPVCLEKFENIKALGRFTLREDTTVAVGKILKIKPLKK